MNICCGLEWCLLSTPAGPIPLPPLPFSQHFVHHCQKCIQTNSPPITSLVCFFSFLCLLSCFYGLPVLIFLSFFLGLILSAAFSSSSPTWFPPIPPIFLFPPARSLVFLFSYWKSCGLGRNCRVDPQCFSGGHKVALQT